MTSLNISRALHLSREELRKNGRKYLTQASTEDTDNAFGDLDERESIFTMSLPTEFMQEELRSRNRPQSSHFERSFTLSASPSSPMQRERSSSVQVGNALKRSWRLSRSVRPSSVYGTARRSLRLPSIHRRKSNEEPTPAPTPESLDVAFEKIKRQLAQLSDEDHSLTDRLERLSEEINSLHNAHTSTVVLRPRSRAQKSLSSEKLSSFAGSGRGKLRPPTVMVSSTSDNNLMVPLEKAWMSVSVIESAADKMHLKNGVKELTEIRSRSVSDASSLGEGLSQSSQLSQLSQSQTCLLVIEDHGLSSGTEDEVFFSQT